MKIFHGKNEAGPGIPDRRITDGWGWTLGWLLAAGAALGLLSLLFAIGPYELVVFKSYFRHPLILFLNLAPVVVLVVLFYCLLGRAWPAFLTAAVVVMGFTFADYYKLKFRDDPLMFPDLLNLKEALSITAAQSYDLTPDRRQMAGLACVLLGAVFLWALVRRRVELPLRRRLVLALVPALMLVPLYLLCADTGTYKVRTVNNDAINQWSSTQVYLSKGFVYPFLHSVSSGTVKPPEGYNEREAAALLSAYADADIPEERQVDVIAVQLEAFADFSRFSGVEGIDWEAAYGTYHDLEEESCTGDLLTNIFAGGTVNTERAVLTGFSAPWDFRRNTNSYGWYFGDQGYTVEGSHPSYEWFYNRRNVNGYLGLPAYYFYENRYSQLYTGGIATDDVLMPEIYDLYAANRDGGGAPYFSFNVTYQGHGPYDTQSVWRGRHFTDGRYSTETTNIVDNYLGSVSDTAEQLAWLLERLREETRPVVVVAFGDHKPWLGYGNSAYEELGVNLDTSTREGFYNYYATRYLIWANEAAKKALGNDFTGEGPDVSACFLMNLLFDRCGWQGDAWTQATTDIWNTLQAVTTVGGYVENGRFTEKLDAAGTEALRNYQRLMYYYGTHFRYGSG